MNRVLISLFLFVLALANQSEKLGKLRVQVLDNYKKFEMTEKAVTEIDLDATNAVFVEKNDAMKRAN
jgi:hypothetical protein